MAAAFGLEGSGKLARDKAAPPEYPDVKAITMVDGTWRMVGEYVRNSEGKESKELFAMAYDPDGPRPIITEKLRLSAEGVDGIYWYGSPLGNLYGRSGHGHRRACPDVGQTIPAARHRSRRLQLF